MPRNLGLVRVPELCTAERLSQEFGMPAGKLMELAEELGETIDSSGRPLTTELMELLAMELGATLQITPVDVGRRPALSEAEHAMLPVRPPVVTLMGHVDHGKTSLLDAFRDSDVAKGEAGGITQGISAFTVDEGSEQAMTFIDTPGHELFAAMRERGARATDIIVLVVAVDAGVQPTTVQAIEYARATGSPLVVAANKMDRPDASKLLAQVTQELLEHGVVPEAMGGEVPVVGVSATKRLHLDELREAILLQAELLELKAEASGAAEGVVLEATIQKGLGVVASVLVQRGALRTGDVVVAGGVWGKLKTMTPTDGTGRLKLATPSTPVRVSGLKELPRTGDELLVVEGEAKAKQVSEYRLARKQLEGQAAQAEAARAAAEAAAAKAAVAAKAARRGEAADGTDAKADQKGRERAAASEAGGGEAASEEALGPKLVAALVKADSAGALEAVHASLGHFPEDRVKLKVIKAEVGAISEADVQLAETTGAAIIGFNVSVPGKVNSLAEDLAVPVHRHRIIYELTDAVKELLEEAIEPILEEKVLGAAEVQQLFTLTLNRKDRRDGMAKQTQVAGLHVSAGEANAAATVRVERGDKAKGDSQVMHEGKIVSLKHFKEEVKKVRRGQECGVVLANWGGCEPGDVLTFFEVVARKPSLYEHEEGSAVIGSSGRR